MSSFNRMQRSFFSRPSRTCSGLSILISCIETFATRFARLCSSCSSGVSWLTSKSPSNSASGSLPAPRLDQLNRFRLGFQLNHRLRLVRGAHAAQLAVPRADGVCRALHRCLRRRMRHRRRHPGCGRTGSAAGSAAAVLIRCVICASSGDRCPGCTAIVTNRDSTSKAADNDAAEVCALSIDGSAFVGLELAHAATISPTA